MAKPGTIIGWQLDQGQREALLKQFVPRYPNVVASHVTLATDAAGEPLPMPVRAAIVGRGDDDHGVEAMVVAIDGGTDRPDGSTFHITWSMERGRRARESNDVLRERGWRRFDEPVPVTLSPARF